MHKKTALLSLVGISASLLITTPALAQGARGEMFRRHFFRGQAYHGSGYAAQINEMGRAVPHNSASKSEALEAIVEEGTRGATLARCAARFKSFDPSTGTYVTRGGQRARC